MKILVLLLGLSVARGYDVPSAPCGKGVTLAVNVPSLYESQWCAQCTIGNYKCVEVQSTVQIDIADATDNAGATTTDSVVTFTGNFAELGNVGSKAPQLITALTIKGSPSSRSFNFRFSAVATLARLESLNLTNVNAAQHSSTIVLPTSLVTLSIDRCTVPAAGLSIDVPQLTTLAITASNLTNAFSLDLRSTSQLKLIDLSGNQFTEIPASLIKLVESGTPISIDLRRNPIDASTVSGISESTLRSFLIQLPGTPPPTTPTSTIATSQPTPTTSTDISSNIGGIVAGVAAACAVLSILGFAILHRRCRRKSAPLLGREMSRRTSSACDDDATTGEYKSDPVTPPRFVTTATSSAPYDATQFPLDARQGYAVLQRTELRHLKKSACGFFTAEYNNSVRVLVQKLEIAVMADAESTDNLATSVGSRMFVQRLPLLASLQHANVLPLLGAIKHSSTSMYAVFGPTSTQANASSHAVVSLSSLLYQDPKKPLAEDIAWATQKKWCLDIARAVEYLEDVQWEAVDRAWTSAQYIVLDDATRTCQVQCMSYLDVSGVPPVQSFGTNSLAWTAPEVVRQGESRRSAAHVFAMAVVFGEVVARVRPYASSWRAQGPVRADIAVMHLLTDTPTPLVPHEFDASVPAEFSTLVRRCLDRDPLKRPSPTDVIAALTQCR